jgi:chromatin remodeling complex protein RSC6
MSGESKKKTLLDLTEDDFKSLLSSSFLEALSKLNQLNPQREKEPKAKESEASEMTVREIVEHALNCPNCGKPLMDFLENRFSKFKEEILKEVKETAKKEERRGGLFE